MSPYVIPTRTEHATAWLLALIVAPLAAAGLVHLLAMVSA